MLGDYADQEIRLLANNPDMFGQLHRMLKQPHVPMKCQAGPKGACPICELERDIKEKIKRRERNKRKARRRRLRRGC